LTSGRAQAIVSASVTLEIETGVSRQEVQLACDYLLFLARLGGHNYLYYLLPEQHIKISDDSATGEVRISIRKPWADNLARLTVSGIESLNPVIAIKRPSADQDLELFGTHLPKVHPDEGNISETEIRIKGHEAQELLVNLAQALRGQDVRPHLDGSTEPEPKARLQPTQTT